MKILYDNNGNVTSIQEKGMTGNYRNLIYDSENRLQDIEFYRSNSLVKKVSYFYDAIGRRYRKKIEDLQNSSNSYERRYVFDGHEILAEHDENNSELGIYTHSGLRTDDTLAVDIKSSKLAESTGSYFYLKDALGSVVDIVDDSGSLIQHYTYSSFGKLLKITDRFGVDKTNEPLVKTSYGYTNRELDIESGLMYYRARYYVPEIGRFLQEDPHPGDLLYPTTLNSKYVYAINNPVNFTDPTGEFVFSLPAILLAGTLYTIGSIIGNGIANVSNGKDFFNGLSLSSIGTTFASGIFQYLLYGISTPVGILGSILVGVSVQVLLNYAEVNGVIREEDRDEHELLINIGIGAVSPTDTSSGDGNCFFGDGYSSCDALGSR